MAAVVSNMVLGQMSGVYTRITFYVGGIVLFCGMLFCSMPKELGPKWPGVAYVPTYTYIYVCIGFWGRATLQPFELLCIYV